MLVTFVFSENILISSIWILNSLEIDIFENQKNFVLLCAALACAESDSAQWERSGVENELLSKTFLACLACLSGAQMASIHEIKNTKKSRDTAPLISKTQY